MGLRLPNLTPEAATDLGFARVDEDNNPATPMRRVLVFTTTLANTGRGPLKIRGGNADGIDVAARTRAYQEVDTTNGGAVRLFASWLRWHAAHEHYHLDNTATNTLLKASDPTDPYSPHNQQLGKGQKDTFCLMDVVQEDPTAAPGKFDSCGTGVQGISPGNGDEYTAGLDGQWAFPSQGAITDGLYFIVTQGNPNERLLESDYTDNRSATLIRVSGHGRHVEALKYFGRHPLAASGTKLRSPQPVPPPSVRTRPRE